MKTRASIGKEDEVKKKREREEKKAPSANIGSPSQSATQSARLCVSPDGHAIYRYVLNVAADGAAALKMNGDGDVSWVVMMAGD